MTYQTWTRKANALEAVKKFIQANVPADITIEGIEAIKDESNGEWMVAVQAERAVADRLQAALGAKAFVDPIGAEPEPAGQPTAASEPEATAPKKRAPRASKKVFCVDPEKNPARKGSKSHAAWEFVANNPGWTLAELKPILRGRMRFISHCLSVGWMKSVVQEERI